jgi:uncharacterized protein (DUF58 family)
MSESPSGLRTALDWGKLAPLRFRAQAVADGVNFGAHRSRRRGAGVEFGGHRNYLPGDDLRFLDRRSMLRHDRLIVREFETETERGLRLVVDASRSMAYRSEGAPGAKLAYSALLAAALGRVALAGQDSVSLDFVGGGGAASMSSSTGLEAFERLVYSLERVTPEGDVLQTPDELDATLARVSRRARRGSVIAVFSDFLDLPDGAEERIAALASGGRLVVGVRVLDPAEVNFPFEGPVRFKSSEGRHEVETDGGAARSAYLSALREKMTKIREKMLAQSGRFVEVTSGDDPIEAVRAILTAIEGIGP